MSSNIWRFVEQPATEVKPLDSQHYFILYVQQFIYSPRLPSLQSSAMSRFRMRRRFFVAESSLWKKLLEKQMLWSLVGEEGADLATGWKFISEADFSGKSSETAFFEQSGNVGMGKELGGGELEYAGPAHSSE